MIKRINCSICEKNLTHSFYNIDQIPIKLSCSDEYIVLSFAKCDDCNTIQLDNLIPLEILYLDSHNYVSVGKKWLLF